MKQFALSLSLILLSIWAKSQTNIENYLKENQKDFFNCQELIADSIIDNYQIVLIGETHGFKANYDIAFGMIEAYKKATDFTWLLDESDLASSIHLNQILNTNDTIALLKFVDNSKTSPAWCKENYEYYKRIMQLNRQCKKKIQIMGTDISAGGVWAGLKRINSIMQKYHPDSRLLEKAIVTNKMTSEKGKLIQSLYDHADTCQYHSNDLFEYKYHLNNLLNYHKALNAKNWDQVRDSCILENFKILEAHYHLENVKMIGIWGYDHVLQRPTQNIQWFASGLKHQLNKKVYSFHNFYFQSTCMIPEQWIPGILKWFNLFGKLYINSRYQNSNHWVTGTKLGIRDMSKATGKGIAIASLQGSDSPFKKHPLLINTANKQWYTTEYIQGAILVSGSKPSTPLHKNKK